eukprot:jgi/Botrbrau1/23007/Bobra.0564s0002.1
MRPCAWVLPPINVMSIVLVLDERMASGGQALSRSAKICCFNCTFSHGCLDHLSTVLKSSYVSVPMTRPRAFSAASGAMRPFFTRLHQIGPNPAHPILHQCHAPLQ